MENRTKSKDFTGTWKKLLIYCRRYWSLMIIAVIGSGAGTILTLLGPDKLSEMTKEITDGLMYLARYCPLCSIFL